MLTLKQSWVSFCFQSNAALSARGLIRFLFKSQAVIAAYWKRLQDVKLGGPTYLAPVIQRIAEYAKQDVLQYSQHYTIGLVVVDGIVNDLDRLVDVLVDTGNLPLSIVVVGVGPADFKLMVRAR